MLLVLVLGIAACGGSDEPKGEATATEEAASPAESAGCEQVEAPTPKEQGDLAKPKERLKAGGNYVATVVTSCGEFKIKLDAKRAPRTGGSFKYLADKGFYDGLTFHRIVAGFVIQGGDPKGDGTGGPGYTVVEKPPGGLQYTKGVVAMAKGGNEPPGASGSQWFVVTAEDAQLPADYAVLGRVAGDDAAVRRLAATPADEKTERPQTPLVIQTVTISRG